METSPAVPDKSEKSSSSSKEDSKSEPKIIRAPLPAAELTGAKVPESAPRTEAPRVPSLHELLARESNNLEKSDKPMEEIKKDEEKSEKEKKDKKESDKPAKAVSPVLPKPEKLEDRPASAKKEQAAESEIEEIADEGLEEIELPELIPEQPPFLGELKVDRTPVVESIPVAFMPETFDKDEPAPDVPPPLPFAIPLQPQEVEAVPVTEATLQPTTEPSEITPAEGPAAGVQADNLSTLPKAPEIAATDYERYIAETAPDTIRTSANTLAAREKLVADRETADEIYAAEKAAQSRGVTSGLFVGYLVGRWRGRKKAERAAAREIKEQQREHRAAERAISEQLDDQASKIAAVETERNVLKSTVEKLQAKVGGLTERAREALSISRPENSVQELKPMTIAETRAKEERERLSKQMETHARSFEVPPEDRVETEAGLTAPEGRRFETSAWHRYEVDKNTGRLVEDPELIYGKEFESEQRQERLAPLAAEPKVMMDIGQAIVNAPNLNSSKPAVKPEAGAGDRTAKKKESSKASAVISPAEAVREVAAYAQRPLIWAAALTLVVLLFVFGLLS